MFKVKTALHLADTSNIIKIISHAIYQHFYNTHKIFEYFVLKTVACGITNHIALSEKCRSNGLFRAFLFKTELSFVSFDEKLLSNCGKKSQKMFGNLK